MLMQVSIPKQTLSEEMCHHTQQKHEYNTLVFAPIFHNWTERIGVFAQKWFIPLKNSSQSYSTS